MTTYRPHFHDSPPLDSTIYTYNSCPLLLYYTFTRSLMLPPAVPFAQYEFENPLLKKIGMHKVWYLKNRY